MPFDFKTYGETLERMLAPILPYDARTVLDLFCGNGIMTAGTLHLWPSCTVYSVDFYEGVLSPTLVGDARVIFHPGWVHELLADDTLPIADLTIIGNCSSKHGFTSENINSLASHIRSDGYLLTFGENTHLEAKPWFVHTFQLLHWISNRDDASIWKPK